MKTSLLDSFVTSSLEEDIGNGDHSSMACIPADAAGKARLLIKGKGILAGCRIAREVFLAADPDLNFNQLINDGAEINTGDIAFYITGRIRSILKSERLVLNIMQRMSGIATSTRTYVEAVKDLKTKVLDTRKTTPGIRFLEKEAVRIGGGYNHRMGLYDMIMLKDNHIDYAGGIEKALGLAKNYVKNNTPGMKIEIEARSIDDIKKILAFGGADRILLDNFSPENTREAVRIINGRVETESSGGITLETIRSYAECGVDFVSVGALTHHIKSLDMSLKAV